VIAFYRLSLRQQIIPPALKSSAINKVAICNYFIMFSSPGQQNTKPKRVWAVHLLAMVSYDIIKNIQRLFD
jgi:hypothetical protein